jgi:pSer/pThr/pTyr-binding forkhead associated (FHA) protein
MAEFLLILRFALAGLLYGFLALLFYLMWQDLRHHARSETSTVEPATLTAESDATPEQQFSLRTVTAIGRNRDNHLMIDDPFASANHAIVVWREGRWWIEDLDSHNGTYLNGERVTKPQPLTSGDRISIGETDLRFATEKAPEHL